MRRAFMTSSWRLQLKKLNSNFEIAITFHSTNKYYRNLWLTRYLSSTLTISVFIFGLKGRQSSKIDDFVFALRHPSHLNRHVSFFPGIILINHLLTQTPNISTIGLSNHLQQKQRIALMGHPFAEKMWSRAIAKHCLVLPREQWLSWPRTKPITPVCLTSKLAV